MARTLYFLRLSDDVARALYREGQQRRMPMAHIAGEQLWQALASTPPVFHALCVCGAEPDLAPLAEVA